MISLLVTTILLHTFLNALDSTFIHIELPKAPLQYSCFAIKIDSNGFY